MANSISKQLWLYFFVDNDKGHPSYLSVYDVSRGFNKFKLKVLHKFTIGYTALP